MNELTAQDKQLLLVDLCARLPYHPKGHVVNSCNGVECDEWLTCATFTMFTNIMNDTRLYLRPMSTMTEDEEKILEDFGVTISPFSGQIHVPFDGIEFPFITMQKIINYLYSIHIDINGLIPKCLAIEVTEDNNPYKEIVL